MTNTFLKENKLNVLDGKIVSWGSRWEARSKIVTCFGCSFVVISLNTPVYLLVSFSLLLLALISMGFSLRFIFTRVAILLPFLILMSIPLIFGNGLPLDPGKFLLPILIIFKAFSVSFLMIIMIMTQPLQEFLNGLSHMSLPPHLVSILFLSWRYTLVLWETLKTMHKSLISRCFNTSINKNTFRTYGEVLGGILVKALDKSDNVHKAMLSRGFTGKIPTSKPKGITKWDLVKSFIFLGFTAIILLMEKGCLL